MSGQRIVREAGLILAAAVLLGVVANALRPESRKLSWTGAPTVVQRPTPEVQQGASPKSSEAGALFTEITSDVAYRMHSSGALFLDARRTDAYQAGHIAGARSIPVWEHDADARVDALRSNGIPFDKDIVIYCSGAACEDSARLAEKLAMAGFYRLSLYKEGFPDWEKRGWPVTRGAGP